MIKIFRCECLRLLCNKFSSACWRCCCSMPDRCSTPWPSPAWPIRPPFRPGASGPTWGGCCPCVGGGPVFPHLFHVGPGAAGGGAHRRHPRRPRRYALARCAAALVGVALLCLAALALAALLYARLFGWTDWGSLALPALVILAPPLVFALGSGWLLGRLRPWLLYVWMLLPFALAALPLPEALGLWNGGLCTSYPLTLGMLDPAFSLPAAAWAVQGLLLAAGVLLCWWRERGKRCIISDRPYTIST
ncbi:hypothetical protein M5E87_17105 [Flavonifractor plautii]|nr:hypothetical protein M5E87_17105 [Flavonifractor plautii]